MKISKRQFCIRNNLEFQWFSKLRYYGMISTERKFYKNCYRDYIEEKSILNLKEGIHYVSCPKCGKKMASVTKKHIKSCKLSDGEIKTFYSLLFLEHIKKSEKSKILQSQKLKERFKTPKGEITRKIIGEASKKINSNPEFLKRKSEISKEIQNRPEIKRQSSIKSKKMWSNPDFIERKKKYVEKNKESLIQSATRARKSLNKTSKLHKFYKRNMEEKGLKGFISEYSFKFYSIDEADPYAKIAIEIDGCYWHGCVKCDFPGDIRIMNIDKRKETFLRNRGWTIIRIKEHEIKKDPYVGIEAIKSLQKRIRDVNNEKIKSAFLKENLKVKSMIKGENVPSWSPISTVLRHNSVYKTMYKIHTEIASVVVTEDHSLFLWGNKIPVKVKDLKVGDKIIGLIESTEYEPVEITNIEKLPPQNNTYDISVPESENFTLDSGILAHNSYSISGVNLDLDKSSKYEAMKNNFLQEWEKSRELIKLSIKIIKGLRQPRYGIGISSALGPYSRPGTQSRRNFISGFRGGWA